jgi:hypothetical protein
LSFVFIVPSLYLYDCYLQKTAVTSYCTEVLNEFWGSHCGGDSYCGFLGNGTIQSGPYVKTFRGNILPPSSKERETNLEIAGCIEKEEGRIEPEPWMGKGGQNP